MNRIVVVGAGQAGASLCARLRAKGYTGALTLIGAEPVPPYQRPPLSKAYLLGEMPVERLYLRPESFYADQGIDLRLGAPVTGIDRDSRTVTVGDEVLHWDALALTTGSAPRRLPAAIGGGLDGVATVRTLADVDDMAPRFAEGARVLIVESVLMEGLEEVPSRAFEAAIGVFAWRIKNKVILLWQLVSVSFQLFNQRRAGFTVFRELASRQEQATRAIP